jgi:subtilase family serine protease
MLKYDKPRRASNLARTIASDIWLYNKEATKQAIKDDNLFEALEERIEEGRAHYKSRVTEEICENHNFYERALVDKLMIPVGDVDSDIW